MNILLRFLTHLLPYVRLRNHSRLILRNFEFRAISETDLIVAYKKLKNRMKTAPDINGLSHFMLERTIHAPIVTSTLEFSKCFFSYWLIPREP
jgi:hypothetical protein